MSAQELKREFSIHDADAAIRVILEGTAGQTGESFFASLVKSLSQALSVTGAWVTEFLPEANRLRALSFWFQKAYVSHYEYDIAGTPCEQVIRKSCLVHFPDNVVELFPADADMRAMGGVSYIGAPLLDVDGATLGHLAVLDTRPMPMEPRLEGLFRIFAARAAAALQRRGAERQLRHSEERLNLLFNSAMDAVIELNRELVITAVNRAASAVFGRDTDGLIGRLFPEFLAAESAAKLDRLARELDARPPERQSLWIAGGLSARRPDGTAFPAEASLARFEHGHNGFYTLILRNIHDQVEAERKLTSLVVESAYLQEEIEQIYNYREIVGDSPAMRSLFESVRQVSPTGATVLIHGETGTGKELVARAVHAGSRRARKPLIKVNCAAIPLALMESEFFGHERGAFTGATSKRVGRFALADGGTIFLDEIGELPVDLQAKLLRVLQEGEFEPVGSSQTKKVDVRVIAATNRDLPQAIKEGKFREDLYYRLSVFPVRVPPLRERGSDIELLAEAFARKFSQKIGVPVRPLSRECLRRLREYDWPGNVRELQNAIERAVITSCNGILNPDTPVPPADVPAAGQAPSGDAETPVLKADEWRELERWNLLRALESAAWRVSGPDGAAGLLGVPPSTLASRMKALGIVRPR